MLESIAHSPFGFWIIALVIVLLDSAVLIAPGEFAFAFDRNGQPRLRIPAAPFVVRNKDLLFASLSYFAKAFFVSSTASAQHVDEAQMNELRRLAARCRAMCAYSYVTAAVLVVAGPAASLYFGISLTLVGALPVLYINAILTLLAVFVARKDFDMSPGRFGSLAFELIVCPALVVNLNKRLIDRTRMVPNTAQLIGADDALLRRVNANLDYLHVERLSPS